MAWSQKGIVGTFPAPTHSISQHPTGLISGPKRGRQRRWGEARNRAIGAREALRLRQGGAPSSGIMSSVGEYSDAAKVSPADARFCAEVSQALTLARFAAGNCGHWSLGRLELRRALAAY